MTKGFEGNGNEFGFYFECDGESLDEIQEKTKERSHWKPWSKSVMKAITGYRKILGKIYLNH